MNRKNKNELAGKFLGSVALNPLIQHDSSSRIQMLGSHLGQRLTIEGATERKLQTGIEREYGKYTFRVEMPVNGLILEVIDRYPVTLGQNSINHNPQTTVIYENVETKEVGILHLTDYCSNHQYFGFKYTRKPGVNQIRVGNEIKAGTVFLDSPAIKDEGGYAYGIEANLAYLTMPAGAEDGVIISDEFLPKLGFRTYETRVVEWGKKMFALNAYGDENNYQPFPNIGDYIRDDGILMALRSYDPVDLTIVEQGIHSTRYIDYTFDKCTFAAGPGGRIIDIRVNHDLADANYAAIHMDTQVQKYDNARRQYYMKIMEVWKRLKARRGDSLQISKEFHQLVMLAQSVISEGTKQRVNKLYRKAPLDIYRVEFVVEYLNIPSNGFKITNTHGGKGVFCKIVKAENMPVDAEGNRADIIMEPNGIISRSNPGQLYEQFYNATARDTHKRLCAMIGVKPFTKKIPAYNEIVKLGEARINEIFQYLYRFYSIISPVQASWFDNNQIEATIPEYLAEIVEIGIGIYLPTDNQPMSEDIVEQLGREYPSCYGPISYVGNSGRRVTTKYPARIGSVYMLLLEKTGDDWSAVSSGKLQHFGVLSQLTRGDKYSKPARNQAVRVLGEAEGRIMVSYIGPRFMAEMMDRNNNPKTHKMMVEKILRAEKPSNIDSLVNRKEHPFGGSKPLQLLKHILQCGGIKFTYRPYVSKSKNRGE